MTEAHTAAQMRAAGADTAALLRAGDVVILDGPLGAGKTTFVQGVGAALGVRVPVTSPTFVIARVHMGRDVSLVHVDAYRLVGALEVDDLDLDADVDRSITVVEWGSGKVEGLSEERLVVTIERLADPAGGPAGTAEQSSGDGQDGAAGPRQVRIHGIGKRWADLRPGQH